MNKGLLVFVYRNGLADCTNGGVTAKAKNAVLVGTNGPFEPNEQSPALHMAKWYGRVIACPADLEKEFPKVRNSRGDCTIDHLGGWMFGGNFVYSSDSRFPAEGPIPVYDRREW